MSLTEKRGLADRDDQVATTSTETPLPRLPIEIWDSIDLQIVAGSIVDPPTHMPTPAHPTTYIELDPAGLLVPCVLKVPELGVRVIQSCLREFRHVVFIAPQWHARHIPPEFWLRVLALPIRILITTGPLPAGPKLRVEGRKIIKDHRVLCEWPRVQTTIDSLNNLHAAMSTHRKTIRGIKPHSETAYLPAHLTFDFLEFHCGCHALYLYSHIQTVTQTLKSFLNPGRIIGQFEGRRLNDVDVLYHQPTIFAVNDRHRKQLEALPRYSFFSSW